MVLAVIHQSFEVDFEELVSLTVARNTTSRAPVQIGIWVEAESVERFEIVGMVFCTQASLCLHFLPMRHWIIDS
jgi:hypothetical protein